MVGTVNTPLIQNPGYIISLLQVFSDSTNLAVRMEIAKTLVEMWRIAHRIGDSNREDEFACQIITRTYGAPCKIATPLIAMIVESKNPSLVTEGWLGLALMAGTGHGCDAVHNALNTEENTELFDEILSSQDSNGKDRQNAQILANTLFQTFVRMGGIPT